MWRIKTAIIDNFLIVLLLIILLDTHAQAQRTSVSYIRREVLKDIGDKAELDCSVQYAKKYIVQFLRTDRDPVVLLSTGTILITTDPRFSLHFDPTSSTYKLQIKDIQETDAGTYTCQVTTSSVHQANGSVKLYVRTAPIIPDNSINAS